MKKNSFRSTHLRSQSSRFRRSMLETLESRELLAILGTLGATLDSNTLTVSDVDAVGKDNRLTVFVRGNNLLIADQFEQFIAAPAGGKLLNGDKTLSIPMSLVGKLEVNGRVGNDLIYINSSGGNPIPVGGIDFNGGAAGSDVLTLDSGITDKVRHDFSNATDGSVTLTGAISGSVRYTGAEVLNDKLNALDRVFSFPDSSDTITLDDIAGPGLFLSSNVRKPFKFASPTNSLLIQGQGGNDTFTVQSEDTSIPFSLQIDGNSGNDLVGLKSSLTFATDKSLDLNLQDDAAFGDLDRINILAKAAISLNDSGSAVFTSSGPIALAASSSITTVDGDVTLSANQSAVPLSGSFIGIDVNNASIRSTGTGNISLAGQGGNSSAQSSYGIRLHAGGQIQGGIAGSQVTMQGTGGNGTGSYNYGVLITDALSQVTAHGGKVNVTGIAGAGTNARAIVISNNGSIDTSLFGGDVTLSGDSMSFFGNVKSNSEHQITVRTATPGTLIHIGGSDTTGVLGLSNAELSRVLAGTVQIGDTTSGTVFVTELISSPVNLSVVSGDSIRVSNRIIAAPNRNLSLSAEKSVEMIGIAARLQATGMGGITVTAKQSVNILYASLFTVDGDILVQGNVAGNTVGNFTGVTLLHAGIQTNGTGNISIQGQGGNLGFLNNGITEGYQTVIFTKDGNISLSGTGGGSALASDYNIGVQSSSTIYSSGNGNIQITGTGGSRNLSGGNRNAGVVFEAGSFLYATTQGNITITGTGGGSGLGTENRGVVMQSNSSIQGSTLGDIFMQGTGGAGDSLNNGVFLAPQSSITAHGGNIFLTGNSAQGSSSAGLVLDAFSQVITKTVVGNITLAMDSLQLRANAKIKASTVTLTNTPAISMLRIGEVDGPGQLSISNSELNVISAGKVVLQASGSKTLLIDAAITSVNNLTFVAGLLDLRNSVTMSSDKEIIVACDNFMTSGGSLTTSGTGAISVTAQYSINLSQCLVTSQDGNVSFLAHQGTTGLSGNFSGIYVYASKVQCTGNAKITLQGTAGDQGTSVQGITIIGSLVQSNNGDIVVRGTGMGGLDSAANNFGVRLQSGGKIKSTGVGNIDVYGIGGRGGGSPCGIYMSDFGSEITAQNGSISLTGISGGDASGSGNRGVVIILSATVQTLGQGTISLNGTGGPGVVSNEGIAIAYGGIVTSAGGNITMTGVEGAGNNSFGIHLGDYNGASVFTALKSSVTKLVADSIALGSGLNLTAKLGGQVALQPRTPGTAVLIGDADAAGSLGLTDGELDHITAGMIQLGDATAGAISIVNNITRSKQTDIQLSSGDAILFTTGSIDTNGGNLLLSSGIATPLKVTKTGSEILLGATGTLSFAAGAPIQFNVAGRQVDTEYDQLNIVGLVNLTGASLMLTGSYITVTGDQFTLIENDGTDSIIGTFAGLAEGAIVTFNGKSLKITYQGGSGNDVVLVTL